MAFQLEVGETRPLTLTFRDTKGNVIASPVLDGVPTWGNDQLGVLTLTAAAGGGPSASVTALSVGTANISVSTSCGGVAMNSVFAVEVVAAPVGSVEITPGDAA